MDQNQSHNATIGEIQKALGDAKRRSEEINRGLTGLSRAMDRCRAVIAEHASVEQKIAALRTERRTMLADSAIGNGDPTALAKSDRDLKNAEARLKELATQAEDARAAIAELEARYAVAQSPLIAMGKEIPRLEATLLEQAIQGLLDAYGEKLTIAYDAYAEIIVLVQMRNAHARAAGMPPVLPETPSTLDFPGLPFGKWQLRNTMVANPQEMEKARDRLATKLADMGIPG